MTLDEFALELRRLKLASGNPSISEITRRVHVLWANRPRAELPARSTVGGLFVAGRRRPNVDLVLAVVEVLVGDAALVGPWRRALWSALGEPGVSVVELPEDVPFVGRPVSPGVLTGMPGIGKTALAVHSGHSLVRRGLVDGPALFVRLGNADPAVVLESAVYRRMLASPRPLVVLDDAVDAAQVRPLLPARGHVFVTSRSWPSGVPVAPLSVVDAVSLVCRVAAPRRLDSGEVARIAEAVGCHPLALTIVGRHLRAHPDWLVADYAEPLLPLVLEGGVRAVLASADRALPFEARRLLRLLTLHPGDCDLRATAALANASAARTTQLLDVLVRAHLLASDHRLHPLVRAYAAERRALDQPKSCHRRALARLWQSAPHVAARAGAPA